MTPRSPTVVTRRYIRWSSDPATEPTTTLVLTSPAGHFVDIRPLQPRGVEAPDPLPVSLVRPELFGLKLTDCGSVRDPAVTGAGTSSVEVRVAEPEAVRTGLDRLDWAFAGLASSSPLPGDSEGRQQCKWDHWIDSRTPRAWDVVDEGVAEHRVDDGVEWEIETGSMASPAHNGEIRPYEEGWLPLPSLLAQQGPPYQLIRADQDVGLKLLTAETRMASERVCVVLSTDDLGDTEQVAQSKGDGDLGLIVRVGDWCQGVIRLAGGEFEAMRCVRIYGRWKTLVSMTSRSRASIEEGGLNGAIKSLLENGGDVGAVGEKVDISGCRWVVRENMVW